MIISVKKRIQSKAEKFISTAGLILLSLAIASFELFHSIIRCTRFHDGVPLAAVGPSRYTPVLNEAVLLVIAGIVALLWLNSVTNWSSRLIVLIGVILYVMIGGFVDWAYGYTRQGDAVY